MALPTDVPFTIRYPLRIGSDGGLDVDTSVNSQVRHLFTVNPGQRIDNRRYGMPAQQLEQAPLQLDAQRLLILLAVQRSLLEFVPEIQIISLDAYRTVAERRLVLDVIFRDRTDFEQAQRILMGLGFTDTGQGR